MGLRLHHVNTQLRPLVVRGVSFLKKGRARCSIWVFGKNGRCCEH
jgi:hypothetical protein